MSDGAFDLPTRLFSLAPIGMGTATSESLLSYLVRLAREHSVSPRQLIRTEILPLADLGGGPACSRFYADQARTIVGVGKYAHAFTSVLCSLTRRDVLKKLTMLPWADVLPSVGFGLIANQVRWCPDCLRAQRQSGADSNFPLTWSLECYQACPTHGRRLASKCPWCDREQHVVPDYPDLHRCTHCRGFLGSQREEETALVTPTARDIRWALLIEAMVADADDAEMWATHANLCRRLVALADAWTDGEKRALSLRLGLSKTSVSTWVAKQQRPVFPQLLQLCESTGLEVRALLSNIDGWQPPVFTMPASVAVKPRQPVTSAEQRQAQEESVRTLVCSDNTLSAKQAAAQVGLTVSQLRYRHRAAMVEFSKRYRLRRAADARLHWFERRGVVQAVAYGLVAEGRNPSIRRMTERLSHLRLSLKNPTLRQVYRNIRSDLAER